MENSIESNRDKKQLIFNELTFPMGQCNNGLTRWKDKKLLSKIKHRRKLFGVQMGKYASFQSRGFQNCNFYFVLKQTWRQTEKTTLAVK